MKYLFLFFFASALQLKAASIAICIDSNSEGDGPFSNYKVIWSIDIPSDVIRIGKPIPVPPDIKILCGGHLQAFDPSVEVFVEIKQDGIGAKVIEAVKAHPQGHLMLLQNEVLIGIIRSDLQMRRESRQPLESFIDSGLIEFRVPKPRIILLKSEPNKSLQTTTTAVTECAPSRTFRASCGRV